VHIVALREVNIVSYGIVAIRESRALWLLNYLDATDPPCKKVLDQWFSRTYLGRGAIFSSLQSQDLTAHLRDENGIDDLESSLLKFWVQALHELRLHELTPIGTTREGACGQPLWYNPHFEPPPSTAIYQLAWKHLSGTTLDNTVLDSAPYSNSQLESYLTEDNEVEWHTVTTKLSPLNSQTKPKKNTTLQNYTRRGGSSLKP
jgi:hypothetical protein